MKELVIDVSSWQGKIDWAKVKPQISGAILRCGYGSDIKSQDDEYFKRNADECTRLGIPFGVYLYSYAKTEAQAKSEAAHVLRLIKDYKLAYPVYYDLEEKGTEKGAVERAKIFAEIIEKAGYWCGIYANLNWWNNYLKGLDGYTKWVAQYNTKCDYKGKNLDMWQYSSGGTVKGISGRVDMNWCYRDFPVEINGKKVETETKKETVKEDTTELRYKKTKGGEYRCTADLCLRVGASTEKVKLEVMPKGSRVTCGGHYAKNGKTEWLYVVSAKGKMGFCSTKYLERE